MKYKAQLLKRTFREQTCSSRLQNSKHYTFSNPAWHLLQHTAHFLSKKDRGIWHSDTPKYWNSRCQPKTAHNLIVNSSISMYGLVKTQTNGFRQRNEVSSWRMRTKKMTTDILSWLINRRLKMRKAGQSRVHLGLVW